MKTSCSRCGKQKAKRPCARVEPTHMICSLCCVELRDPQCADCEHYAAAQAYRQERRAPPRLPNKHFMIEINPEVTDAVNAAMELMEKGATGKAWTAIAELNRLHPGNHVVLYAMGTWHAMKKQFAQAIACLDQAIEIFPNFSEAYFNKAVIYQKQMDVKKAIRAYRKVIEVGDPKEPEVENAHTFIDDMEKVIRESEGIDLDTYLEAQDEFDHAFARMHQGDYLGALEGFQAASAKNECNAPTHGNMGLCHAQLGHKAKALAELDRALELDPGYHPARINRFSFEKMKVRRTPAR